MGVDMKNMETFIQVAELCSFTKAAKKLGYSQSTVSFQIRQLEEDLKVQLLERINHTVALTEAGRKVLDYAHQLDRLTMNMRKELKPQPFITGHIRIAMADSLACWILQDHFEAFRREQPGITLKLMTASTQEMFRLLNQNEADLVEGRLIRLEVPDFAPQLWRQLLYHRDKWVSPAMQAVIGYFSGKSPAPDSRDPHMLS